MAITYKQAIMVLHQGTTASALAPQTSACSLFVVLNQRHPVCGGKDKQALLVNKEANPVEISCPSFAGSNQMSSSPLSAMMATGTSNQLSNLPAEMTYQGVTVTLDNNNMWNEFYRCQTEMILTKPGRRMFPYCRFRISGLEPFQKYTLVMDMHPVDNHRYKWSDRRWETNGKADPHILRSFVHPDSPATGLDWMQNPVSFYKLKLTNNPLEREDHIVINSMHRYLPRLHIIPADKAVDVVQPNGPDVITFSFPQTEFFAVTAYQNLSITQLKIDYNPFAKGFREDAYNARIGKSKLGSSTESEVKFNKETATLNNLKSLFAKRNVAEKVSTNGDRKTVQCDSLENAESDRSSSKKRPGPGVLSELIKSSHIKEESTPDQSVMGNNTTTEAAAKTASLLPTSQTFNALMTETMESSKTITQSSTSASDHTTSDPSNKATLPDKALGGIETSLAVSNPEVCGGEVKKKRAEPVPLPLLALFFQQLKTKTRTIRVNSKSVTNSDLESQCETVCDTTSVNNSVSASTESLTQSFKTRTRSETSSATQSTTCPIIPDSKASLIPDPDTNSTAVPITHIPDAMQAPIAEKEPIATSADMHSSTPVTLSFAADVLPSPSADIALSCRNENCPIPTLDTPLIHCELKASNHSNRECITEPSKDSGDLGDQVGPETISQSVLSGVDTQSSLHVLSSPHVSPPSSAPSSPDPFPPDLFSERPIPPRKSLDPFPTCLSVDRPRSLIMSSDLVSMRFGNNSTHFDDMTALDDGVSKELISSLMLPDSCIPMEPDQSLHTYTQLNLQNRKGRKVKPNEYAEVTEEPTHVPVLPPFEESTSAHQTINSEETCINSSDTCISKTLQASANAKCTENEWKCAKSSLSEESEMTEGPIPIPLQPNLEDVEGQLFVSFMSKKALDIHLGDESKEDAAKKRAEKTDEKVHRDLNEQIDKLEMGLLHDLKIMKHKQVIHPVLQAVGLKLNLLDLSLAIDLQYLGVCLPIPPAINSLEESSESCTSQVPFVSRTGKTSDLTKIKGWRDKFAATTPSSVPPASACADAGQKNLSAFCSDMLDEYLESEGKLIDERAASFTQAVVTPVAYQMPTKSTSYVRTLDSVLKKQTLPTTLPATKTSKSLTPQKRSLTSTSKAVVPKKKLVKSKSTSKSAGVTTTNEQTTCAEKITSQKVSKLSTTKSVCHEALTDSTLQSKKIKKDKTPKETETSEAHVQPVGDSTSVISPVRNSKITDSSFSGGCGSGTPKTLVQLRDVEDGAVWEGKPRTWITEERAAIALSCIITAEGKGSPFTIIKRRASPCLNDFCRLGCVCASLVHERQQHHCGKPQCMLGCDCLRRKVVVLKKPLDNCTGDGPLSQSHSEDLPPNVKKKKRRFSFILYGSESTPEPAKRVTKLWDGKKESDLEPIYIPTSAKPPAEFSAQQDFQKISESKNVRENHESELDCARIRPFCRSKQTDKEKKLKKDEQTCGLQNVQEVEDGELLPPALSGPSKRLEIVSKCSWSNEESRNVVLRMVCEKMAQDRLDHTFSIGSFQIEPLSKRLSVDTEGEPIITYKVVISQKNVMKDEGLKPKNKSDVSEKSKQLEAQLIKTIGTSEVKGLPLLSQVTPAGLLSAEKKVPGAPGHIMVNGKTYPQAKLELGHMGALHPANRLAAYITGKVCLANKSGINEAKTATITKTSSSDNSVTTTSLAKTPCVTTVSSTNVSAKPTVMKPLIGNDFAQVVIRHINSQQQKLPNSNVPQTATLIKKIVIPSSVTAGHSALSITPSTPPKTSMASESTALQVSTAAVKPTASAVPLEKTFVITTNRPCELPSGGANLKPGSLVHTTVPRQKVLLFKTSNGNMMCRNSAGQLVQLVPLNQFKVLNTNSIPQQSNIRLPNPSTVSSIKSQMKDAVVSPIMPTSSIQLNNVTPMQSTPTHTITTTTASTVTTKSVGSLSGSDCLISNLPGTFKLVPGFLSNTGTATIPQQVTENPKVLNNSNMTITTPPASEQYPSAIQNSGHIPKASIPINNPLKQCSKSADEVAVADHSYTFEKNMTSTLSLEPDVSDGSVLASDSSNEVLVKKVLDEKPVTRDDMSCIEEVCIDSDSTDLTEDSDMYDQTETANSFDLDDLPRVTDSKLKKKNKRKLDLDNFGELDSTENDDELVDIETVDERRFALPGKKHKGFKNDTSDDSDCESSFKCQRRRNEQKRRCTLKSCFSRLQQTLGQKEPKVSKVSTLTQAVKEIELLTARRYRLIKKQNKLMKKKARHLKVLSKLSEKSEENILKNLDKISHKQKSLMVGDDILKRKPLEGNMKSINTSSMSSLSGFPMNKTNMNKSPKHTHAHLSPNSRPIDLRINKEKRPVRDSKQDTTSLGHIQFCNYLAPPPIQYERTRPNILSHNKSLATEQDDAIDFPKISCVVSLVSKTLFVPPPSVLQITDDPVVIQTQEACHPASDYAQLQSFSQGSPIEQVLVSSEKRHSEVDVSMLKNFEHDEGSTANVQYRHKDERKTTLNSEQNDESLLSLLDELVFLNQQLNNETTDHEDVSGLAETKDVFSEFLMDKGVDRDDERSLSPLFLKLDEDLITPSTSKDELDDIPPKVDDLVKAIFGSDSPSNSSESELITTSTDGVQAPGCRSKHDLSPPPLLQMKAGGVTIADSVKEQANISWRPMPKLAPLGLKTLDAVHPKAANPHVSSLDSNMPCPHRANI